VIPFLQDGGGVAEPIPVSTRLSPLKRAALRDRAARNGRNVSDELRALVDAALAPRGPVVAETIEKVARASTPRARRTDPGTSHRAARSVRDLTEKQAAVYALLRDLGPMSDARLVNEYRIRLAHRRGPSRPVAQSSSGIRTRRSELVRGGLVAKGGEQLLPSGRWATVWAVVE
jgi:plasmid stability protein